MYRKNKMKLNKKYHNLVLIFCISIFYFIPQFVSAQTAGDIAKNTLQQGFVQNTGVVQGNLGITISSIVTILLSFLGIIFFILAVYAGYIWTTAEGDEGKIGEAKQTIIRASLGFFVVISSYALSSFITTQFAEQANVPGNGNDTPLTPGPLGCCLDKVSATGRPGPDGLGVWTDRFATQDECSRVGNDPNDPGDVRYGDGTWQWRADITPDNGGEPACEEARRAK